MTLRLSGIAVLLWTAVLVVHAAPTGTTIERRTFETLDRTVGPWEAVHDEPLSADVVTKLGVDDYVNRYYVRRAEGARVVALYAGFHRSQRRGDTIHSPLACLPGTGWQIERTSDVTLTVPAGVLPVREVLVRRGLERSAVVYWYQGRGRTTPSDYQAKLWLAWDGILRGRSDGGMVRVMTPLDGPEPEAWADLRTFATALAPKLGAHFPG